MAHVLASEMRKASMCLLKSRRDAGFASLCDPAKIWSDLRQAQHQRFFKVAVIADRLGIDPKPLYDVAEDAAIDEPRFRAALAVAVHTYTRMRRDLKSVSPERETILPGIVRAPTTVDAMEPADPPKSERTHATSKELAVLLRTTELRLLPVLSEISKVTGATYRREIKPRKWRGPKFEYDVEKCQRMWARRRRK